MDNAELIRKLLVNLFSIFLFWIILRAAAGFVRKNIADSKKRYLITKRLYLAGILFIIIATFLLWANHMRELATFLSIFGAGLALSLHQIIGSIAGWALVATRKTFSVGDRIEINGIKGDVIDIGILRTVIMEVGSQADAEQSTGRIVTVPNSLILQNPVYNFTSHFEYIWNEIDVTITFDSSEKKAEEIMLLAAEESSSAIMEKARTQLDGMRDRYYFKYSHLTPIVYMSLSGSGIKLTLRHLIQARNRRAATSGLIREIYGKFMQSGIKLAYDTYRIIE